ncbi:MAG TPA: molybdopterin oxidoreductase [Polyangiaceae bacterium]
MLETPKFVQGVFVYEGRGLSESVPLRPSARYKVSFDKRAQLIYLRAGNSVDSMIYLALYKGERPVRFFPIGAKGAIHVELAIVEDIDPETELELRVGAPEGVKGVVLVDLGLLEI